MRIYQAIKFKGARKAVQQKALIDTGAGISLIPLRLAKNIGAWRTNQNINIVGVHEQSKTLELGIAEVYFLSLNDIGGQFPVAVSDVEKEPIIGMDILKPLGISIDTATHQLSVKNEFWEAFKTLSGIGVLTFVGIKLMESVFEES